MKNINLFLLILLLALLATLLIAFRLLKQEPPRTVIPSALTPTPKSFLLVPPVFSPTPSPKQKIINQLPIDQENYSVQYLPKTDEFLVLIKKNPYSKFKKEVLGWFRGFGLSDPEKELPLLFTSSRWVGP